MKKKYNTPALYPVELGGTDIMFLSSLLGGDDPYISNPDKWEE